MNEVLVALKKFDMLSCLNFGRLVFGAVQEVSKCFQARDTSLQEAISAVNFAWAFYRKQRSEPSFNYLYDQVFKTAHKLGTGIPALPRYWRIPSRLDNGSYPHQFSSPHEMWFSFEGIMCHLLLNEFQDRLEGNCTLAPVMALESLFVKEANREDYNTLISLSRIQACSLSCRCCEAIWSSNT